MITHILFLSHVEDNDQQNSACRPLSLPALEMGNYWLLSGELLRMAMVFARRVRYDQQISYCLEWYLLQPACLLKAASNKEPVAEGCKDTEYLSQMGLVNVKFMKNEGKMCFFIHNVHLCHFVTLWVTSFFSHLPRKSYFSSLTFLVSLSCQLIFLSPRTPVSPISSFLISPNTTLFFSFFCRFFLYICRTDIWNTDTAEFYIFHALQSFFDSSILFPVCFFSCGLCSSLCFSCTQLEIKIGMRDRKLLQCQWWGSVLLHRNLCGLAWSVVACQVSSTVRLTTVINLCCGQVHGILRTSTICVFHPFSW